MAAGTGRLALAPKWTAGRTARSGRQVNEWRTHGAFAAPGVVGKKPRGAAQWQPRPPPREPDRNLFPWRCSHSVATVRRVTMRPVTSTAPGTDPRLSR